MPRNTACSVIAAPCYGFFQHGATSSHVMHRWFLSGAECESRVASAETRQDQLKAVFWGRSRLLGQHANRLPANRLPASSQGAHERETEEFVCARREPVCRLLLGPNLAIQNSVTVYLVLSRSQRQLVILNSNHFLLDLHFQSETSNSFRALTLILSCDHSCLFNSQGQPTHLSLF